MQMQHLFKMEAGPNMNFSGTQGSLLTNTNAKSYNDIMTRRQKNRERQCRYRARKRLEAEMQKSRVRKQPTITKVELKSDKILYNAMARVHCKRDWKKDARRAHICKSQEDVLNASVQSTLTITSGSQKPCLPSGIKAEGLLERECHSENSHNLVNGETRKLKLGRRDWKADARNKNN